jgi:copper chaperone NosL
MMAKRSRILILLASLALGLMYALPVWTINLEAPQYPEGLGMVIQINTIEGKKQHDLNNINNLNHYIGMRRIVPESIPELKIMPVMVAVLMVLGGLVALVGRKRALYAWAITLVAVSVVGMADFWKWEYDYGHNLDDENAIIKIPGMSYQPPLIGSRQILNFTAHSWPGAGGWAAILAVMTTVVVAGAEWRRDKDEVESERESALSEHERELDDLPTETSTLGPLRPTATMALVALVLAGCGEPESRPLSVGVDRCADCLMAVDVTGHGSELVTTTGKVYTFDSVECLTNYLLTYGGEEVVHSLWVTDFANPDDLVHAEDAHYLVSDALTSPMGLGVTAFSRIEDRDGAVHAFGGDPMTWVNVQALVEAEWPNGRPERPHGGHASTIEPGTPSG